MQTGNQEFQKLSQTYGTRKFVYVVFCDVSASTELAKNIEPEIFGLIMHKFEQCVRKVMSNEAYGGEYVKSLGDGFLIAFGYPELKEKQAELVVKAMHRIEIEIEFFLTKYELQSLSLKVHMGANAGTCIVIDKMDGTRDYLGDPVNVAKKICDFAQAGEITISDEALGRTREKFIVSNRQAIRIAGHAEKIVVSSIVGEKSSNGQPLYQSGGFVGRHTDIDWLMTSLNDTNSTLPVMIQAEAGMGKSRLIRELTKNLTKDGVSVHIGQCEPDFSGRAYKALDQIIYSLFRSEYAMSPTKALRLKTDLPDSFINLAKLLDKASKSTLLKQTRDGFEELLLQVLTTLSGETTLIVIDDWQWIDDASQKVVEAVMTAKFDNLQIVLASRKSDPVFEEIYNIKVLLLGPLKNNDIEQVVKSILPGYDPFTLERILEYSGGNPLYLEELCYGFRDQDMKKMKNLTAGTWLNGLITTRFEKLTDDLSHIIRVGAVIGHNIPEWLLSNIVGYEVDNQKILALREADFIHPTETSGHLRFKHRITRDVLYRQVGLQERQMLHGKVIRSLHNRAAELGEKEPYDQLAYHYSQSGKAEKTVHYSKLAGEFALKISALDRAQNHFRKALEQSETIGVSIQGNLPILRKFGLACVIDPAQHQTGLLRRLAQQAFSQDDSKAIAWTHYWLGNHLYGLGQPLDSVYHLDIAYKNAIEIEDEKLKTQLIANLGQGYASACQYGIAYKFLDQAIEKIYLERQSKKSLGGLAYALSSKGYALGEQGRYEDAENCFEEAIDVMGQNYPQVLTSVYAQWACSNIWNGNTNNAKRYLKKGIELSRQVHSKYNYSQCIFMEALLAYRETGSDIFLDKMLKSTQWLWSEGIGQNLSLNFANIAEAFALRGDWDNARKYVTGALLRARKGDRLCESQAYCVLARLAMSDRALRNPEYYIRKAYASARARDSMRELRITQEFEQTYVGGIESTPNR